MFPSAQSVPHLASKKTKMLNVQYGGSFLSKRNFSLTVTGLPRGPMVILIAIPSTFDLRARQLVREAALEV